MNDYPNVMIDIETMGVHTSRSVILSVGAVAFRLRKIGPDICEVPLFVVLSPQDDRRVENGTQLFWDRQSKEARAHWEFPDVGRTPGSLLAIQIESYLKEVALGWANTQVWSNGVVFDLGNLENLMDCDPPWKYSNVRDARTVYKILPKVRSMPADLEFLGHEPVDDCKNQIWWLWEHWPEELLSE